MNLVSTNPDENPFAENIEPEVKNAFVGPILVSTNPELNPYAGNAMGLPSPSDAGLGGFVLGLPSLNQQSGIMSAVQKAWDETENMYKGAYQQVKSIIGTVYEDTRSAAGTVYDDVSKPVSSILTGSYWYLILGIVVIAGGLYFIGKTGAIKVKV